MRRKLLVWFVLGGVWLSVAQDAGAQQAVIHYVYDDLGRLVAVVDADGNAAVYTYDAVGNILAIRRADARDVSGPVAIMLVSPNKGKIGTQVSIYGKGFSSNAGQNAVSFGGSVAAVTAATGNGLTTSVPAGAVTGPITVATPLGAATSPTPFRVLGVISVSPTTASILVNGRQQFTATEAGNPTPSVTWSVNGVQGGDAALGTISPEGLYTAPATIPSPTTVTVSATHTDDRALSGFASVTILPPLPVFTLAHGVSVGLAPPPLTVDKNVTGSVSVGMAPASWALVAAAPVTVTPEPVITAVSPSGGVRGVTNLPVTITGSGFRGATALTFLRNNAVDGNIAVATLAVNTLGTQATAMISIAVGAPVGARVTQISTPSGSSTAAGIAGNLFTVQ